jgi:MarR family transcriptional regulator, organic hydroperoxide resistance regulator
VAKNKEAIPEIIDNFMQVIQVVSEYSKAAEKATSLTGSQIWALKIIANVNYLRVSDLAHEMHLTPATVVGIIDRLEEKGLVTRSRSKMDRRVVELYLTDKGSEIASYTNEITQTLLMNGLDELSDEQFACIEEGMKLIARMLGPEQITLQL